MFSQLNFQPITMEIASLLEEKLSLYPHPLAGYSLTSLICWMPVYRYSYALLADQTLLISPIVDETGQRHLLQPIGEFSSLVKNELLHHIQKLSYPMRFFGITPLFHQKHIDFFSHFYTEKDRNGFNYIYESEKLATLSGRKLQKKRNLISQASRIYSTWHTEPLTLENKHVALSLLRAVEEEIEVSQKHEQEILSVENTLNLYEKLPLEGLLLYIENEPAAFSIYEIQNNIAIIHIEKGLRKFHSVYQIINQETAKKIHSQEILYINREEDFGDEGLRQAKLSYQPFKLEEALLVCCIPSQPLVQENSEIQDCQPDW